MVLIGAGSFITFNVPFTQNIVMRSAMWLTLAPLLLLCWIRKLNYLVLISILANIRNIILILVIVCSIISDPSLLKWENPVGLFRSLPSFFDSVMFTLNATGIMIPLKNKMKEPRKFDKLFGALKTGYIAVSFLYVFFGLIFYLKYKNKLQENVIENLPQDQFITQLIVIFYIMTLVLRFPLIVYILFDVIWNNLMKEKKFGIIYEYRKEEE